MSFSLHSPSACFLSCEAQEQSRVFSKHEEQTTRALTFSNSAIANFLGVTQIKNQSTIYHTGIVESKEKESCIIGTLPLRTMRTLHCLSLLSFLVSTVRGNGSSNNNDEPKNSVGEWEEETGFYQAVQVTDDSPIYKGKSEFQEIEVHKSKYYGKILMLDGVLQVRPAKTSFAFHCHDSNTHTSILVSRHS